MQLVERLPVSQGVITRKVPILLHVRMYNFHRGIHRQQIHNHLLIINTRLPTDPTIWCNILHIRIKWDLIVYRQVCHPVLDRLRFMGVAIQQVWYLLVPLV